MSIKTTSDLPCPHHLRSRLFQPLKFILIGEALFLVLLSVYFLGLLNFHMDELQIAYPFGCHYVDYVTDLELRESCGRYDLRLPFWSGSSLLPLRVADYIGSIQGIFYYPFWKLLPHVFSVRIFRIALLCLGVWGIARALKAHRSSVSVFILAFMPLTLMSIAFAFSEILFCLLSFFYVLHVYPWQEGTMKRFIGGILLGLIITVSVMMRLNLLLSIPGLWLSALIFLRFTSRKNSWKAVTTIMSGLSFSAASLLTVYLSCRDWQNQPLANQLREGTPTLAAYDLLQAALEKIWVLSSDPLLASQYHRLVPMNQSWIEALCIAITVCLLLCSCYRGAGMRVFLREQSPWFAYLLLTVLLVAISPSTYGWHHFLPALAAAPVIVSYAVRRRAESPPAQFSIAVTALATLYFIANLSLFLRTLTFPVQDKVNAALPRWSESLRAAYSKSHLLLIGDWGPYYFLLASGDEHLVMIWPWNLYEDNISRINKLKNLTKRPLLLIHQEQTEEGNVSDRHRHPLFDSEIRKVFGEKMVLSRLEGTRWVAAELP